MAHTHTHTHTHTFNGPFSGTSQVSRYQKGKTNLDFTEARDSRLCYVICYATSSAICKSALRYRQIAMPAPHHSVFYRPDVLPAAQPTVSKHWRNSTGSEPGTMRKHHLVIPVTSSLLQCYLAYSQKRLFTKLLKTAFSLEHANATYFIICIPEHAETGFLQDFTAEPITVTICCITNSNRLHHCCHLVNNFGHVGYSLYFPMGQEMSQNCSFSWTGSTALPNT